jgi:hypothetical protein
MELQVCFNSPITNQRQAVLNAIPMLTCTEQKQNNNNNKKEKAPTRGFLTQ